MADHAIEPDYIMPDCIPKLRRGCSSPSELLVARVPGIEYLVRSFGILPSGCCRACRKRYHRLIQRSDLGQGGTRRVKTFNPDTCARTVCPTAQRDGEVLCRVHETDGSIVILMKVNAVPEDS